MFAALCNLFEIRYLDSELTSFEDELVELLKDLKSLNWKERLQKMLTLE